MMENPRDGSWLVRFEFLMIQPFDKPFEVNANLFGKSGKIISGNSEPFKFWWNKITGIQIPNRLAKHILVLSKVVNVAPDAGKSFCNPRRKVLQAIPRLDQGLRLSY